MDDAPPSQARDVPPPWQGDSAHLWSIDLTGDTRPTEFWSDVLSAGEVVRAERFASARDRRRFTVGRGALRRILAAYVRLDPAELPFEFGPGGKPALPARLGGPRFNLSHAGDLAVLALVPDRDVGVDVERVRSRSAALDIAARYWTPEEYAACLAFAPADGVSDPVVEQAFAAFWTRLWTRKEALVKGLGGGMFLPLERISTWPADRPPTLLEADGTRRELDWALQEWEPSPTLRACTATFGRPPTWSFFRYEPAACPAGRLPGAFSRSTFPRAEPTRPLP